MAGTLRPVDVVDPADGLWLLDDRDVQVDHDRLLVAADQDALELLVGRGVDLLMGDERGHEDEVARPGLGGELQPLAPAHPSPALHHVDDALELAVMVGAGLRVRVDHDGAGPQLPGAGGGGRDRCGPVHPGRLGGVGVQIARADHPHAVELPPGRLFHRREVLDATPSPGLAGSAREIF
jgi:hypothetical protein